MTRLVGLLAGVVLLVLAAPAATAAEQGGERMLSYVVHAEVGADGTVAVTERIRYHFDEPRHGIFRFIPLYYPLDAHDARTLEIDGDTATMDGRPVPFVRDEEASGADENWILRVGDEHREITGDHDYQLGYRIRGLLNAPAGRPELFWNALGKDSKVPVDHAEVTVTAPGPIDRVRCVVGARGTPCAVARVEGNTARFAADGIEALSAVTVTAALPDGVTVPPPIVRAKRDYVSMFWDNLRHPGRESGIPGLAVAGTVALFALGAVVLGVAFYRGRDRYFAGVIPGLLPDHPSKAPQKRRLFAQREAAAVRFDPPDKVPPALCGVIMRKKADRHAVSAAVTDLAVRGHLTVTQLPKGFRIARTGEGDGVVAGYESGILGALGGPVTLRRRRKDGMGFRHALGQLPGRLMDEAVHRRWFVRDPRRNTFRKYGGALLFLSVFALIWLFDQGLAWFWVPFTLTVLVLLMLPSRWLVGRTAVGSAMLAQVLDFRRYIETAEAERLAAEERQAIFNRYLPYAQAFGLAEHWTRKFAAVGAAEPSGWYQGPSDRPVMFDSYPAFASTVDSSPISVSSSTGSSSGWSGGSSGFSSSSSGGGDGGGGGGAGSW
ncbi:MAG TPA: DUF2207 domain-containing protein [Actinophytocola sp.]|uniref:DUF2207 domain-containing protein n=1 Tax=Actinophytocola sp. TaxID=1872138 RepID=UPI002DDCAB35|nr:DUF2207 domain-containing protein [Actinophytocola sp.]HEV2781460.1 DUF2207 domain-containing protein [Actinophytocola sp.]